MRKRCLFALLLFFSFHALGDDYSELPVDVQAPLLAKVLDFSTSMNAEVSVYVLDSDEFAASIKKAVGKPVGEKKIVSVVAGKDLPTSKPDVLYVGNSKRLDEAVRYAKENHILTATGIPRLVKKGISLGFGLSREEKKPKILLNRNASKQGSVSWNAAIFKIAVIQEE